MDRDQEVKLTHSRISDSLYACIERLEQGYRVNMADVERTPEVQLAKQVLGECPQSTLNLDARPRLIMRNGIARKLQSLGSFTGYDDTQDKNPIYDGYVNMGRELHIVVGLPASGKSSNLVDVISKEFGARVLDNDMTKQSIPEYWGGWGAGAVHEEAKEITDEVMERCMSMGENIVVPKLGTPPESLQRIMDAASKYGYNVSVHMMDVNPNKAIGRMLSRFVVTGRYDDPSWMEKFVDDPELMNRSFEETKKMAEEASFDGAAGVGYSIWTNNVDRGDRPILKEFGGKMLEGYDFIKEARTDLDKEVLPEDESEKTAKLKAAVIHDAVINDNVAIDTMMKNKAAADIIKSCMMQESNQKSVMGIKDASKDLYSSDFNRPTSYETMKKMRDKSDKEEADASKSLTDPSIV